MFDSGRRSTMQPAVDPHNNARSHLPVPPLGPYPPMGQVPGTNPRQSMMRSQNVNPLLQSATKPNFGRTPLHSSTRRGSMWAGGSQGSAPSGSQGTKDTRPLRDRQFQAKMRQDVVTWLLDNGMNYSPQVLQQITSKDFRTVYQDLVRLLDPEWPFTEQKFEEQFVQSLRALRYPYLGQLDIRTLTTPGAMHTWPLLLGVLHWLAEMGRARTRYLESKDVTLQDSELVPDEFEDINHHQALALDHCTLAYGMFLEGKDAFPEEEKILEARYARKDEKVVALLEMQREELHRAQLELEALGKAPAPIEDLKKDHGFITRDKAKFEEILRRCESKKKKLIDSLAREKADIAYRVSTLEELQAEEARLAAVVREQNLSPEEVIRMNTEHETLTRDLETLKHKIAETNQVLVKLEVSLTRKVSDAEEALDMYANLLANLGLFPPLPPPLEGVDLTLDLNSAAANPQNLLSGADIRRVIKPTLSRVAEMKRTERADVESERIKVDNELDQLTLECENMDEEVLETSNKVNALNDQADELREAAQQEALVSNAEATRLERDLAQARTAALANGVGVKSRLQALQIAHREQIDKVNRLKDETMRAIIKNSSDIVMFKEEVSKQLKHLRDFAEAN
ncbi:HEC/Ndc80p family-domain-containing protein [Fomitopsis serialis]|uniref:HEC/Ndc80p family-domain-containing protein n=1 Tax=Fomitopsis serialis TaxID=139415 RepID=UPI0020076A69|nr:HEC/Ndc80p family-domain-containing protein [Neoantrodia serialis]KAH9934885.1 HEC/Ndc80p family-domain-containing protein [Neoantrodia serialis]